MWYQIKRQLRDDRTEFQLAKEIEDISERLPRWFYTDRELVKFTIRLSKLKALLREITED